MHLYLKGGKNSYLFSLALQYAGADSRYKNLAGTPPLIP